MATVTLKGNTLHTSGELPEIGAKAPDFHLATTDLKDVSLADFAGKKKLLNIVPSLDTGVCALSTRTFNQKTAARNDVAVLVVSADLPFAQKRFVDAEGLTHVTPLSLMRGKGFAKDYGVLLTDGPLAGLTARAVVVLDEANTVVHRQLVPEITEEPDYDAALNALGTGVPLATR